MKPDPDRRSVGARSPHRALYGHWLTLVLALLLLLLVAIPSNQWHRGRPARESFAPYALPPEALERIESVSARIAAYGYRWRAGVTAISHLTPEQFDALLGARPPADEGPGLPLAFSAVPQGRAEDELPPRWDWREFGGVTPVRDQETCGSCWAFAAAGALEAAELIYATTALDLSEQHVLDCNADDYDCAGGWMTSAYRLWHDAGARLESDIPYEGIDHRPCDQAGADPVAFVESWSGVTADRMALKQELLLRPLAVAMHVYPDFQHYQGGVYYHPGNDPINHAVLLVGWDDNLEAWIIKNSWGAGWGEFGFAYVHYDCCRLGTYAHGLQIETDMPLHLYHQPLADTIATAPLTLAVVATSLTRSLDEAEVRIALDLGGGFSSYPLERLAGDTAGGVYAYTLAPQSVGTEVAYLFEAEDATGGFARLPAAGGPDAYRFRFLHRVWSDSLEAAEDWTAGLAGDDAESGWWEWGIPEGTVSANGRQAQPEGDHTESGSHCFVTGAAAGSDANSYDVDAGTTTLETPALPLAGLEDATLRAWYWFSNHTGSYPWEDGLAIWGQGHPGEPWVLLETITLGAAAWRRLELPLDPLLPLSDQTRLRFVVADELHDSTVEAAIDDLEVVSATSQTTGIDEGPGPGVARTLDVRLAPNPMRSRVEVRCELPAAGRARAIVLDASGRVVRSLADGIYGPGPQRWTWDGTDEAGRPVAAGRYWVRIATEEANAGRALLLLR